MSIQVPAGRIQMMIVDDYRTIDMKRPGNPLGVDDQYDFTISEYWDSCALIYNYQRISRRSVITYMANILGGTHYSQLKPRDRDDYMLLDQINEGRRQHGRQKVLYVYMSICQALVKSPDIQRFEIEAIAAAGLRNSR